MKILTKNNVIIEISHKADIISNGIKLDNYILAISVEDGKFTEELPEIYDVKDIPSEIQKHKYCYEVDKGFYINDDYRIPNSDDIIKKIQEDNAYMKQELKNTQKSLAEMMGLLSSTQTISKNNI